MNLQTDGQASLQQQEIQLQSMETFFVEVVDFQAGQGTKNDVITKSVAMPGSHRLQLKIIQNSVDLPQSLNGALTVVFDRVAFVAGQRQRVVGFRT